MTTPLRALLEQAELDISRYRHPRISEAQEALNAVLQAAGMGSTGTDEITGLTIGRELVRVSTRYSVRCCEQTDTLELPVHLIDAEDPVRAAQVWSIEESVRVAVRGVAQAEIALSRARDSHRKAVARYNEL